jgi:PH (Pleckstrin Homology) domain-containing protein
MVHEIVDGALHLYVEGMDKVWAFKSQLTIPLKHITAIRVDDEVVRKWYHGLKVPGTSIPYVITAGTYYQDGKRVFWDVHHPKEAVVISLDHEKYNELVIEVEDPEAFVQEVQEGIRATGR